MIANEHLLVFGYDGEINLTKEEVKNFLFELAKLINLHIINGPVVEEGTAKPGLTGMIIIEESHIAVHTFTNVEPSEFWLDILSCKQFDKQKVIEFFQNKFNFKKIDIKHK